MPLDVPNGAFEFVDKAFNRVRCLRTIVLDSHGDIRRCRRGTNYSLHAFFLPAPFSFFRKEAKYAASISPTGLPFIPSSRC